MCRLAYIPKPFDGMQQWLTQLDRSMGGDGIGVAIHDRVIKAVKLTVAESAAEIIDRHAQAVASRKKRPAALWHSRRTSCGGHHDQLCHPFPCDGGWLAHNGHFHAFAMQAITISTPDHPMSDTRLFAAMVAKDGFVKAVTKIRPPGVWLHMRHNGKLAIWKGSGDLHYCLETGVIGSEPWSEGNWLEVDQGLTEHGKVPTLREPRTRLPGSWLKVLAPEPLPASVWTPPEIKQTGQGKGKSRRPHLTLKFDGKVG